MITADASYNHASKWFVWDEMATRMVEREACMRLVGAAKAGLLHSFERDARQSRKTA